MSTSKSHVYDGYDDEPFVPHAWRPVPNEDAILDVLRAPRAPEITFAAHFQALEQELRRLFDALSIADARELRTRLANEAPAKDDVLAQHFHRLLVDRQQRLITFLADTPRRAARRNR